MFNGILKKILFVLIVVVVFQNWLKPAGAANQP